MRGQTLVHFRIGLIISLLCLSEQEKETRESVPYTTIPFVRDDIAGGNRRLCWSSRQAGGIQLCCELDQKVSPWYGILIALLPILLPQARSILTSTH